MFKKYGFVAMALALVLTVSVTQAQAAGVTMNASLPTFEVGTTQTFTVSTVAGEDINKNVVATFQDLGSSIVAVEYEQDGAWYPLTTTYGPADGFPLGDVTSTFRATFAQAGNYSVNVVLTEVLTGLPLATTTLNYVATPPPDPLAISISSETDLVNAIKNQADGQTWTIASGNYGLDRLADVTVEGQTGWYFPITKNNITIIGAGESTVIYGKEFSLNGSWSTQNLISVLH